LKLKTLIFKEYFNFFSLILIAFFFYFPSQNLYKMLLFPFLIFLLVWHLRGSPFFSLPYTFLFSFLNFLPSYKNLFFLFFLLLSYPYFKKLKLSTYLLFSFFPFTLLYFSHSFSFNLSFVFLMLWLLYFYLFIFKKEVLESLIFTFIFLEFYFLFYLLNPPLFINLLLLTLLYLSFKKFAII